MQQQQTSSSLFTAADELNDDMGAVLQSLENNRVAGLQHEQVVESIMAADDLPSTQQPASLGLQIGGSPDDDNLSAKIRYLQKKQSVLLKASNFLSRESAYNAASASHLVSTAATCLEDSSSSYKRSVDDISGTIWEEAHEYLQRECRGPPDMQPPRRKLPRKVSPKSPVHPIILKHLAKTVARISATNYQSKPFARYKQHISLDAMKVEGHWMSDCLRTWTSIGNRTIDRPWSIVKDARTQVQTLLPPRGVVLPSVLTIQRAMAADAEARLVVEAIPPFRIVHANRSFRLFTSNALLVLGHPIERFVNVSNSERATQAMDGVITIEGERKACQVIIIPVTESSSSNARSLSHFVLQFGEEARSVESSDSDANESYANISTSGPIIGTVG